MHDLTAKANSLPSLFDEYERWCRSEGVQRYAAESQDDGWAHPWQEPFVVRAELPSEYALLSETFGTLPTSYSQVLDSVGTVALRSGSSGLLRILGAAEVVKLYDNVQDQMDFTDGLREEILDEDAIDFSKLIPVMAGHGTDGCWALLDISSASGQIYYWDNDQAGYLEDVFEDLASFLTSLVDSAKSKSPLRLT